MMKKGILLICLLATTIIWCSAQPGDPNNDADVPISGIEILLGLGGLIGIRKLWKSNAKSKQG